MHIFAFADEASSQVDLQIRAMLRNHLNGLEIRSVDGTNVSEITLDHAREVRKKMDDAGLKTWSIGSPIGKIFIEDGDFEKDMEKFKNCIEVAHILGAENIRLFSFRMSKTDPQPEKYRNEIIERMNRYVEVAKGSDLHLCHENEKGIYGDNAVRCKDLFDHVPGLDGIFDPANFVQCHQDTWEAWQLLKNHIRYMHIKDALSTGDVVPAGLGEGNVERIVKEFIAMGGENFTIEPHLHDFGSFKALELAGEKSILGQKYIFKDSDEAFDAACNAFQRIIA